ncbi:conserved hypothetical protein [Culex quinquefasciatus]|uniref:Protein kinase domain-containing protein n=1 Tax=Culex quinquefasciatus TaxID=7176 RepID=B0XBI2_CULQU|nr:conserved hypothetical protein [Culex quinquefasciatus]|eukprot:XP_001867004.1 conserved hypothetical protein [Culex quinquefasciatus]
MAHGFDVGEGGHSHLTDFNIATRLQPDGLACSMSGTKPYMAPEVFMCALEEIELPGVEICGTTAVTIKRSTVFDYGTYPHSFTGYSYPVDWWSLGVVAYEMRSGQRPFVVHSSTPLVEVKNVLNTQPHFPRHWSDAFIDLLGKRIIGLMAEWAKASAFTVDGGFESRRSTEYTCGLDLLRFGPNLEGTFIYR